MIIELDKEYDVRCNLGTIRDIENVFGKPFFSLASQLDKLTTLEQIKLLYIGVKRADSTIKEEEFINACENNMGIGDLSEYLEQFLLQLQYPGLSKEEVQQKIEKKLRQAESLRASIGAN